MKKSESGVADLNMGKTRRTKVGPGQNYIVCLLGKKLRQEMRFDQQVKERDLLV